MKLVIVLAAFLLLPSVFISCGQKGPLTLPSVSVTHLGSAHGETSNG